MDLIQPGRGLGRRRFLELGGLTVAGTALLVACGDDDEDNVPSAGLPTPTTGLADRQTDDIVLLRTASSLEHSAVFTYDAVLPMLPADLAEIATTLRAHHEEQAADFEALTEQEGGTAFAEPNPSLQAGLIEPTLEVIAASDPELQRSQTVIFLHSLETIVASTYQSFVPILTTPSLREDTMAVGTVTARNSAVWAGHIEGAQPVAGLDTLDAAPTTAAAATTTTVAPEPAPGETTTTTSPALALPADGVFQVPGAFGSLVEALGPNSYVYDERTLTTTEEG